MMEKQFIYWLEGVFDLFDEIACIEINENKLFKIIREKHREVICRVIEDGTELK